VSDTVTISATSGIEATSGVGSTSGHPGTRERFAIDELAIVLSHYDLGVIKSVKEFPRGSRRAPKLYIESEKGRWLVKRRARGREEVERVALAHDVQLFLAERQFPLPRLLGTRADNQSMLRLGSNVYEVFEYISGAGYSKSPVATSDAGRVLALFHKLLEGFSTTRNPALAGYHHADAVTRTLAQLPNRDPRIAADLASQVADAYTRAARAVEACGIATWPRQVVHADWHPGNMLFSSDKVVAVIDYDSVRLLPRVLDIANGALQFSLLGGESDLSAWPEKLDESRFVRFLRAYDKTLVISQAEIDVIPPLMIEALISETVFPVAATGLFGRFDGSAFLRMVMRKIGWLEAHGPRLSALIAS
jgi:homoserine kinase type II